jgi:chaperonin GroES
MSLDKLAQLNKQKNIADMLENDELVKIGHTVIDEFQIDSDSRAEWESQMMDIMKIAKQTQEVKNTPWPNASNVKYPLITNASIQFAARNYPEIVQTDKIVRFSILGDDPTGMKEKLSDAIAAHMSYQMLVETDQWEREIDSLLHILPVVGLVYTKVYYDPICQRNKMDVCTPETIIVNDAVKSLESARRVSHLIYLHKNDIISGINMGIYSEEILEKIGDNEDPEDPDMLHEFVEQHRFWDLDDDGYQEPYVITVHKKTNCVMRIVARWDMDKVIVEGTKLIKIVPVDYFTDWHFIPSPDGKWHSIGFGALLFPINHSINTLINQLIDSGTMNNLQTGIIGRGIRIKGGSLRPRMGEFIVAEASDGTALKDNIVPFPTKEPSATLFQLLGMMIEAGEKLASITDVLSGQQAAQNAPATSVLALEEQGLKVFTGIQKRLYRSLKSDLVKLFRLNRLYFSPEKYDGITVNGLPISKEDYIVADKFDICPVFDPNMATDIKRLSRAQAVLQLATQGLITGPGATEAIRVYLQELRIPDYEIQQLMQPPPPAGPSPEILKIQLEGQRDHANAMLEANKLELEKQKIAIDATVRDAQSALMQAKTNMDNEKAKHDSSFKKIQAISEALGKVDPTKGITLEHIMAILAQALGSVK